MFSLKSTLITIALFATSSFALDYEIHPGAAAGIYRNYDIDLEEEEFPMCQPTYVANSICPDDEDIPCGDIEEIEEFCKKVIRKDNVILAQGIPPGEKENAIEGCKNFVQYRFDEKLETYGSCCPTKYCDDYYTELLLAEKKKTDDEL